MPRSCLFCIISTAVLFFSTLSFGQSAERYIVMDGPAAQAHVFNVSDNTKVADIRTGVTPNTAIIAPGGRLVFVGNLNSQHVSVLDLTVQAEIARIPGVRALFMAATADGTKIVAPDPAQDLLYVVDVASLTVSNTISLNGFLGDDPTNPNDLGLNNPVVVGNKVYLNSNLAIGVVDLATSSVTTIPTTVPGKGFSGIENLAVTADGKYVLANRLGALLLIDPTTDTVAQTLTLGNVISVAASQNAADPTKIYGYLLRRLPTGPVFSVLDLATGSPTFGQVIADVPLPGAFPLTLPSARIAANGDGTRAYITSVTRTSPNVLVVDTVAALTNPAAAIVTQLTSGALARGAVVGITQTQAPVTAPVVSGVSPSLVKNDVPNVIQISGSNFTPDAHVRVGNLDLVPAQVISSSSLQVMIPVGAAAQGAAVVVSNPNSAQPLSSQWQSGILKGALIIASPPAFQPVHQVGAVNFGEASFSTLNISTNATVTPTIPTDAGPIGLAITPDGSRAYIEDLAGPAGIDVYNFATGLIEKHITLNGDLTSSAGQNAGIVFTTNAATGQLLAYVVSGTQTAGIIQQKLYIIDTATESVVDSIPTGAVNTTTTSGGLAVTPDGKFAFINEFTVPGFTGNLIVLDIGARTSTIIPDTDPSLGISVFQPNIEMSPDGKYILLRFDDGSFGVFDIGTNPIHPNKVATLRGTTPAGFAPLHISFPRITGNHVIALDNAQNFVDIFNFNPAANDFAEQASFVIPGTGTEFAIVPDVTPDGKLYYVPEREQDSVAVVDVNKILLHDPTAFVTNISTGIAPTMVRVRPGTPTPVGANVPVQPTKEVGLTFSSVTGAGASTVSTTNTNPDPLPAGFSIGNPPVFYEISSTASFSGTVQVCISYNPAQFNPPESSIRMLHDDAGGWTDVTTSLDTVNHIVCGNVLHFSPFTLGTASAPFLFNSLIQEVSANVTDIEFRDDLLEKLQQGLVAFNQGDKATALQRLDQFEEKVQDQTGSKLSQAEATKLLNTAKLLGSLL